MGLLVRFGSFLAGLAVAFAGYFLMAAEGWPQPLESMSLERGVIGALIGLFGLALIWTAFKPARRARSASRAFVSAGPMMDEPAPESVVDAAPPATEPEPEPELAHAAPMVIAPAVIAVAASPEPTPPEAEPSAAPASELAELLAKGDRLFAEGRSEEALDPYAEALALARQAHAETPDNPEAVRALAGALKSNADVYDEQGRLDAAIEHYEESLKLNRALAAGGAPSDQRALSLVLERLGDCREARGHRSRAADLYRESLGIAEGLVRADPGNALYADDLAVTRKRLVELEGEREPA